MGRIGPLVLAGMCLATASAANVTVTTCTGEPPIRGYRFFACTAGFPGDRLVVSLTEEELLEGSFIVAAVAPAGHVVVFGPGEATFTFPVLGAFECVPALPGDANKFGLAINTPGDDQVVATLTWYHGGVPVAAFLSALICPPGVPTGVEPKSWGEVRSLYR